MIVREGLAKGVDPYCCDRWADNIITVISTISFISIIISIILSIIISSSSIIIIIKVL